VPEAIASLPDMMTALQRADAAGNTGDAKQIAGMIQQTYPAHTSLMLNATPWGSPPPPGQGGRPPDPGDPSRFMSPPVYGPTASSPAGAGASGAVPLTALQGMPALAQTPGQVAGGGAAMPSTGADAGQGGGNWLARAGQDLVAFSRSTLAGIPGGQQVGGLANSLVNNVPYAQGLANVQGLQQQSAQQSPISSAAGGLFGNIGTMAVGGVGAEALGGALAGGNIALLSPAARAAQATAQALGASTTGRAAIGAGVGAVAGGVDALAHGGSGSDVLTESALGAVVSPVVGKAADLAMTKLAPAATRAWEALATKLTGMAQTGAFDSMVGSEAARALKFDPDELIRTNAQQVADNGGQAVPFAASLPAYAQAQLKQLATKNAALGNPLSEASDAWAAQGPQQVPKLINDAVSGATHDASPTGASGVQSLGALESARDATMKAAMDPIRGKMVLIGDAEADLLQDPAVQSALGGRLRSDLRWRINDAVNEADDKAGTTGALSIDDIESVRGALQRSAASPDPTIADPAAQARDAMAQLGSDAHPEYGAALQQYGRHNAYIEGYKEGLPGTPIKQVPGAARKLAQDGTGDAYGQGNASGIVSGLAQKAASSESGAQSVLQTLAQNNTMRDSLSAAYGPQAAQDLANTGARLSQANAAMRAVSPNSPVGPAVEHGVGEPLAHVAANLAVDSHLGLAHNVVRLLKGMFGPGAMSDAGAAKLASMMGSTDPQVQRQAVAIMRRQGATDAQVARVAGYASGVGGASVAHQAQGIAGY
jgi:hypothetical protein